MLVAVIAAAVGAFSAAMALLGVIVTLRQKDTSERREAWWRRATWAIAQTTSDDDYTAEVGWRMLSALLDSDLATKTEDALIEALAQAEITMDTEPDNDTETL